MLYCLLESIKLKQLDFGVHVTWAVILSFGGTAF